MKDNITIDYYSDVLCVWAWVAQRRIDELNHHLGDQITINYHYMDIFGAVDQKIKNQWGERGEYQGFAKHVCDSVENFDHATVNPQIWSEVRPTTSANAHLLLKAADLTHGAETSADLALKVRQAFFLDARDISRQQVLYELCREAGLDDASIRQTIEDGSSMAELMSDYQQVRQQALKGSPSYIIDNGRQTLYGNVGYRVLKANIDELLKHPQDEASWC